MTRVGVLVRSDNVASLTSAGRRAMIDYGIATVIDLRAESELKGSPGPPFSDFQSADPLVSAQLQDQDDAPVYLNLPLVDDEVGSALHEFPSMRDRYRAMIDPRQAALAGVLDAIPRAAPPPFAHCSP